MKVLDAEGASDLIWPWPGGGDEASKSSSNYFKLRNFSS